MTTISLITPKRLLLIAAATILTLAIAAAAPALSRAAAQTYCVHQAGFTCPAGSVDEGKNLQGALGDAGRNPSTASSPNVVTIGPGTYQPYVASDGFVIQAQYPLQITGAGAGQTTLTDSGLQGVISLFGVPGRSIVSLSGVTVGGSAPYGVLVVDGSIDHVAVDPSGDGSKDENGILLRDSTVKDSMVTLPAGNDGDGIVIDGGSFSSNEIDDVTVDGGNFSVRGSFGAVIHRARLTGSARAPLLADSAPIYIDDSLLVGGAYGLWANDDLDVEGSIQAVNDTIVAGPDSIIGVASGSSSTSGSSVTIYNSIVHGFPVSFQTQGSTATIEVANDNYDGGTVQALAGGAINVSGTIMGTPAFVNPGAGDYHLAWNSPLIDAGDTGLVSASSSATDLDGNPRDVPAIRSSSPLDVGAYEYQHLAPTVVATAAPASATTGTAITFDGSRSSDPDDGDTVTYAWSFDDGATAAGATVTHDFTTPGAHTGTLTVTDPTGLTSKQQTTVTVISPPTTPTTPATTSGTITTQAAPHLTLLGKPSVNGNQVTLRLSCTGSTACTGIHVTETASKTKLVASTGFSLEPGQTKTITLTLNGKGRALLAHFGKLHVAITVTISTAIVKTLHVTLHPSKKPPHRHP